MVQKYRKKHEATQYNILNGRPFVCVSGKIDEYAERLLRQNFPVAGQIRTALRKNNFISLREQARNGSH